MALHVAFGQFDRLRLEAGEDRAGGKAAGVSLARGDPAVDDGLQRP
jgi:hypothetical protein